MAGKIKPAKAKGLKKNYFDASSADEIASAGQMKNPLRRHLKRVGADAEGAKFAAMIIGSDGSNLQSRIDKAKKVLKLQDMNSGLLVAQSRDPSALRGMIKTIPKMAKEKLDMTNALKKTPLKPVAGRNLDNPTYYVVVLTQGAGSAAA